MSKREKLRKWLQEDPFTVAQPEKKKQKPPHGWRKWVNKGVKSIWPILPLGLWGMGPKPQPPQAPVPQAAPQPDEAGKIFKPISETLRDNEPVQTKGSSSTSDLPKVPFDAKEMTDALTKWYTQQDELGGAYLETLDPDPEGRRRPTQERGPHRKFEQDPKKR